ncbi:thioesterase [Streptomyces dangxiongensis]|uniref:Thioesterase n=1 Tax=Streptomyces dangxiongensis TaxID=1442032 RepID=A0A3G2J6A6_9ACTN|nr:alpha/beta fold hydrolase [Streptomyces dangxiongensis]AYN37730.1 thioesterase [Streptomyces dangxiongensis]
MPSTTILCFPPAGAGPSFFRPWTAHGTDLRIEPVEIPGREKRFGEPEHTDMDALLKVIVPELLATVAGSERVVLFGHSFGAVLAYEAARTMLEREPGLGLTLVASGSTRPGVARGGRITGLPDDEFVEGVQQIAGYRHPALDEPELRELLLPPLRADVAMHEGHVHDESTPPLSVPVVAVRGADDEMVSAEQAGAWREITTGRFRMTEIEGGHMYLVDAWRPLLDLIAGLPDAPEPSA